MGNVHKCTLFTNLLRCINRVGAERNLFGEKQPDDFSGMSANFFTNDDSSHTISFKNFLKTSCTVDCIVVGDTQDIDPCFDD